MNIPKLIQSIKCKHGFHKWVFYYCNSTLPEGRKCDPCGKVQKAVAASMIYFEDTK